MQQEILPPLPAPTDSGVDSDVAAEFQFDPDDFPPELEFDPAPQHAKRWAGINAQRQRIFIAHLAASGAVTMAAKVIGVSTSALYLLRKREGADSFAAAWDKAVEIGARRIADTLMEHAIYGIPETLSRDGQVILERRKFNTRAMVHIAASRFPEQFGGLLNFDGMPASATPHSIRRLKEKWREEWEAERRAAELEQQQGPAAEARRRSQTMDLDDRLRVIRTAYQRQIAHDPVKRAAWDLLTGPGTDWDAVRKADAYINPQKHEWHMYHPDMVVPLAAGARNVDWEAEAGGDLSDVEWRPPADDPDGSEGLTDELWFDHYADHMIEGAEGEGDPEAKTVTRGDLRKAAATLRAKAEGWQQARQPVIQHPHGFLANPYSNGGPTHSERDAARRRAERAIAELEREWNAAYSEESWAAWKAGAKG
jgi:hypothetical protein